MQNPPQNNDPVKPSRTRLRLPFEKRPADLGMWSYIHRRGISITVIAYLVFAIIFVSAKITTGTSRTVEGIFIDFPEELLDRELTPQEREKQFADDFSDVRNRISNESADYDTRRVEQQSDGRTSEIYDQVQSLSDQMRANRQVYEEGLRREQDLINSSRSEDPGQEQTGQRARERGTVVVSYYFDNPVRNDRKLVVPAYMCEGGGEVVVNVTLNINGDVTSAAVDRTLSSSDNCMQTTAVNAARSSRFNLDRDAPDKHRGTISYIFVPQ